MFPWLHQLEANWEAIRDELILFVKNGAGMCNVHTTGGSELNTESKWKLAMILGYGKPIDEVVFFSCHTLHINKASWSSKCCIFTSESRRINSAALWVYRVYSSLSSGVDCTIQRETFMADSKSALMYHGKREKGSCSTTLLNILLVMVQKRIALC